MTERVTPFSSIKENKVSAKNTLRGIAAGAAAAWLFWSVPGARAQLHVHVDVGHHPGASVHFGTPVVRPVVRPVVPPRVVVRPPHYEPPAMVRHDHYEAPGYRGAWRNPYRDDYFRRFRPGWRPIVIDGAQYYTYPVLPVGYQTVVVNGVTYYFYDDVYYLPYIYEGQTVFMAVPPPVPG